MFIMRKDFYKQAVVLMLSFAFLFLFTGTSSALDVTMQTGGNFDWWEDDEDLDWEDEEEEWEDEEDDWEDEIWEDEDDEDHG